jgi:alanine dehydrogenase
MVIRPREAEREDEAMVIGVPRERHHSEHRVGITPWMVRLLVATGHTVFVEKEAGADARFSDRDLEQAGATIVYGPEEIYGRADLISRVSHLSLEDLNWIKPGQIICGFHHLAVSSMKKVEALIELGTTLIGYEIIEDENGDLPVLAPMSEMAGQMAVHIGANYLQNSKGGRGIHMGHVPGVAPPTVLVLGAGTVGRAAALTALASGAHVVVVDADLRKMAALHRDSGGQVVTLVAGERRLEKFTAFADVVIGAVLIPGGRAPFVITEEMVKGMKSGSVILDVSIDQGGCVETSRPTSLADPVFAVHGVIHYCVPNMTADIARTASRALANSSLPYLSRIAKGGLEHSLKEDPGLARGVYMYRGKVVHEQAGRTLGVPAATLAGLLEEGA